MNPNEVLKLAKEALQKVIDEKKTNQDLLKSIGPAIVEALKTRLEISLPKITLPAPEVTVNVPSIKLPDFNLPAVMKGEKGPPGERGERGPIPTEREILKIIRPLIPKPIPGKQGERGVKGDSVQGKSGEDGKDGSPDTGEDIIRKINTLPLNKNNMIDASHIKNLSYPVLLSASGKRIKGRQVRDDLSSQCDGSNKTFTLTKKFISNTVQLFSTQFPIVYRPVVDFTENSNGTLTLTAEVGAPASGQTLVALYEKYI